MATAVKSPFSGHPRRPPAHKSVSLRHSPSTQDSTFTGEKHLGTVKSNQKQVSRHERLSLRPGTQKYSSGESSNAERWFEDSNNNVIDSGNVESKSTFSVIRSFSNECRRASLLPQEFILGNPSGGPSSAGPTSTHINRLTMSGRLPADWHTRQQLRGLPQYH